jgi:hypothetical protein
MEMTVALIWTLDTLVVRIGIIFSGAFFIVLSRGCLCVYIPPVFQIMPCNKCNVMNSIFSYYIRVKF